mmetsp:Transcript_62336/g.76354  ORF Transcript_62336/g.76354 Transcript_62336/m.76354 type:complete len:370 (+) Transcript_62336:30-1139(+)
MASIDAIPLISQVKSLVQAVKGDKNGAKRTQERFSKQCIGVSQVRSLIEVMNGDKDAAKQTQDEFTRTAPIVSQIRSVIEVSKGKKDEAKKTQQIYLDNIKGKYNFDDNKNEEKQPELITPNNNNNNISSNYILSNSKDQSMKLWDLRLMNTKSDLNKTKKELQMWSKTRSFDYRYRAWDSSSNYKNKKFRLDKSLVTYKGHEVTRTLCRSGFSPTFTTNNKYVYCGSSNNKIYIYETNTGKLFKTLYGHNDIVRDVTWHPYQPIIVSAAWDGNVIRWGIGQSSKKTKKIRIKSGKYNNNNKKDDLKINDDNEDEYDDIIDNDINYDSSDNDDDNDDDGYIHPNNYGSKIPTTNLDLAQSKRKRDNSWD